MARVTREERKKRRISALSRLQAGWGTGETIQYLMRDYGLTRRSANLDVVWANKELSKGFNNHDKKEMEAWLKFFFFSFVSSNSCHKKRKIFISLF